MSDIFDQYEYLKKFWIDFYGHLTPNEEIDELIENLENQLNQKTRWELQGKSRMERSFSTGIRKN